MIVTERLKLRPWREADRLPWRVMCADPKVMQYLGGPQTAAEADAGMERIMQHQKEHGFCFWAIERQADFAFLGFCGLKVCNEQGGNVAGEIEIGWRLRKDAWGQGFAKEAAYAAFDWGFANLDCERIIALTTSTNARSWGLMDRLRMRRAPELDFQSTGSINERLIVYTRSRGWAAGVRD